MNPREDVDMKETDKGYQEWLELRQEVDGLRTSLSVSLAALLVGTLVVGVLELIREGDIEGRIEKLEAHGRACSNSPHLKNWYDLRDRLDALEREVRVRRCSGCTHGLQAITCEIKPGTPHSGTYDTLEVKPWMYDTIAVTVNAAGGLVFEAGTVEPAAISVK